MNKKLIPFLLVISAFFLFGCGATDLLPGSGTDTNTADQPEIVTENAQVMEEPTDDASVDEETSSDSLAVDTASTCYHPFFPVSEGASWTYQLSTGESYTMTTTGNTDDSFTLIQNFAENDLILTVDWFCSEDGLLQGEFAQMDILNESGGEDDIEMSFETLEWEGETLPNEDLLEVGYQWTATYNLKGDVNMEGLVTTADATVMIDYVIAAIEEVTVPAGTFPQAYRVDSVGEIEMIMDFNGTTLPLTAIDFGSSTWYVEGLGLVKTVDDFTGFNSGMELIESTLLGE